MADPLIKHLSCAMFCDKSHGYSSRDETRGQAVHSVLPRCQGWRQLQGMERVEQGHSAQTVGVRTQGSYSQTVRGPRKMA